MGEVFSLRNVPTYKKHKGVDNLFFDPVIVDVLLAFIAEESHNIFNFILLFQTFSGN